MSKLPEGQVYGILSETLLGRNARYVPQVFEFGIRFVGLKFARGLLRI